MSKRKHNLFVSTYELNDGSDSDDDEEDYTPRAVNRTHHVPHEHISVGVDGQQATMCNPKKAAGDDFVVVDTHGIHESASTSAAVVGAATSDPAPAAAVVSCYWDNPRSAATFRVLRRFHLLSLESKCSGYEFYNSLARETNNTGLEPSRDRMRRRGHDPNGIMSTKPGACALLCPACPQPGINLPPGWEKAPDERAYLNMDYLFFMSLAGSTVKHLYVSYDIACQWHKNIWQRMQLFDLDDVQFKNGDKFVVFLVPKFHLPAHMRLKIVALGRVLLEKIQTAIPEMLDTRVALEDMERSFGREVVMAWTAMALLWESDASKPNPFASTVKHEGLQDIRRRLAAVAAADTTDDRVRGDMHDTEMISMGIQLEEQHSRLTRDRRSGAEGVERETKLRRKVVAWMDVELQFIPHVAQLRALDDAARARAAAQASPGIRAHEMKLWLPSAIANKAPCDRQLYEYEYMLRKGQAHEALEEIRNQLLVRTHEYKWKDTSVRGVKALTRSQGRIEAIDRKIQRAAEQYRAARAALVSLGNQGDAARTVCRSPRKKRKKRRTNHGDEDSAHDEARAMSWIWITQAATEREQPQDVKMNEALRVEWAKTRARAMRWHEEVDLLEEEMRRVLPVFNVAKRM
ncbi:hypothetical protein B0H10DRAFT_2241606, partial [Mycena sp. CBHHK59/15]